MAAPILTPIQQASVSVLPATGSAANVAGTLPYGIYSNESDFISGAVDQVAYVYKKIGGDVLDIELVEGNVYAAYEEAVLEYSYLVNLYQGKNSLAYVLGSSTGSFDQDGELKSGILSSSLSGTHIALKYPKFDFNFSRRVSNAISHEANVGGSIPVYSASVDLVQSKQDYDLQSVVSASAAAGGVAFSNPNNKSITVKRVFYKTPRATWRFYGYYGGLNTIGNLATYGQYSDDSTFEVIPVWQNKLQAMAYEDAIWTRISHYSYEIRNNQIRFFPIPDAEVIKKMWFEFTIPEDPWEESATGGKTGIDGINNLNTLPFANIPYKNINSIGKHWIRRFALACCKEILGQIRSKFSVVPIPGESVTLNGAELLSQASEEKDKLREELKEILEATNYNNLMENKAKLVEDSDKIQQKIPTGIYVG